MNQAPASNTGSHATASKTPRRRCDRGQTLVEFAISFTVFLMTVLGLMEFGILVFRFNMLSNLAQEGARRGTVCGHNTALSGTDCNIEAFVVARSIGVLGNTTDVVVTWSAGSATLSMPGDTVRVAVSRPFNPLTKIVPLAPLTISASSLMIVSR
jgi:Flp pilus assembly protein TadG